MFPPFIRLFESHSPEQTKEIASEFARTLRGGEVVALTGDLGAGKTAFVQGLCAALGISDHVTSPTFAIMNVYHVPVPPPSSNPTPARIAHLDLYRLKTAREIAALGLEEYLGEPDTVVLIEWPDAVDGVQWSPTHAVRIVAHSATDRTIAIDYGNGSPVQSEPLPPGSEGAS